MDQFWDELFTINWSKLVDHLIQGVFAGEEIVHVMHALSSYSLATGFAFVGITPSMFYSFLQSYYNDPDGDWETLCDDCPENPFVVLNFADAPYGFVQAPGSLGAWESGEGFTVYGNPDTSTEGVRITRVFDDLYNVIKAQVSISFRWGSSSTVIRPHSMMFTDGGFEQTEQISYIYGDKGLSYERSLEFEIDHLSNYMDIMGKAGATGSGSYVKIRRLTLWFEGALPEEFEGI